MTETSVTPVHRRVGDSDLEVFPLVLGGNVFGWTADAATSYGVLDAFVAGGGNFIDTADGYSHWVPGNTGGESESIIGDWHTSRGNRDDLVIATKVSTHPQFSGLAADNIRAAADASLARLRTGHIDLYYAHFDDASVPLEETIGALSALIDAGKVRYIALSNYTPERIDEWFSVTAANGFHRAVALQPHYNLVRRDFEHGLRESAERENLAVFPYYSLASGFLAGKYRDEAGAGAAADSAADSAAGSTPASPRAGGARAYLDERGRRVLAALDAVAREHETSVASVSLAWLRQQPTIVAPIASARNTEQLPALLASVDLTLTDADLASLDAASA